MRDVSGATHRYRLHGLRLASDRPLPELAGVTLPARAPVDLVLRTRTPESPRRDPVTWLTRGRSWLRVGRTASGYLLSIAGGNQFHVDDRGARIDGARAAGTPWPEFRHLFLDHVLPRVLSLRGRLSLHATAVLLPRGLAAFLGPAGMGKSTLAASFVADGRPIWCDDCLTLDELAGRIRAIPSHPGFRLAPDSARSLGFAGDLVRSTGKRVFAGDGSATSRPRKVAAIYRLARTSGRMPRIEPLPAREAFLEIVSAAFSLDPEDRASHARRFELVGRLTAALEVKRLLLPRRFESLPAVRALVLADARRG